MKPYLSLLFFITITTYCWGQEDNAVQIENPASKDSISAQPIDTVAIKEKKHSPSLAGGLSAALPGLGQAYNKKYWKIPIVYAGLAGGGYCVYYFYTEYALYRDEYRNRINKNEDKLNPKFKDYNTDNINRYKIAYQRDMQLSIMALALWYFINILDAVVDAHLMSFDVSDNLSMRLAPDIQGGFARGNLHKPQTIGLSFTLNIK